MAIKARLRDFRAHGLALTFARWAAVEEMPAGSGRPFLRIIAKTIAAMDFFTVPTATFRVLYCFFVISHSRRRLLHFNATEHPTSEWITQQMRETFPGDTAPGYLILDRDGKYAGEATEMLKSLGSRLIRTAYRRWDEKVGFLIKDGC